MSFAAITGVFRGQHTKHVNTLCGLEQYKLSTVSGGGTCTLISRLSLGLRSKSPQKRQNKLKINQPPPPGNNVYLFFILVVSLQKH